MKRLESRRPEPARRIRIASCLLALSAAAAASSAHAQERSTSDVERAPASGSNEAPPPQGLTDPAANFQVHAQMTWAWQRKFAFNAAYTGPNSLVPRVERSYSFTTTVFFGWRLWRGAEFYLNPEVAVGVPMSNLTGLGGLTNGELARTSGPDPTIYRARAFLRQTIDLGGAVETLEDDANQFRIEARSRRLVVTLGNLSVLDLFDANRYNHDPRTDFMNWALMTYGAWDYAADARGYSWGFAAEYFHDDWALRAGRFMQPRESNGLALNRDLARSYGDQVELEHAHRLGARDGRIRALFYRNAARMGSYSESLALGASQAQPPDLALTRRKRVKYGMGLNLEQEIADGVGLFARASWSDGQSETYAFTEIDRSLSLGLTIDGHRWGRADDRVGLAWVVNGLSRAHRDYLAAGGLGFFLGDGALNYRREQITEAFYRWQAAPGWWLTLDGQYIRNPGYNADRGPVKVIGVRMHAEI